MKKVIQVFSLLLALFISSGFMYGMKSKTEDEIIRERISNMLNNSSPEQRKKMDAAIDNVLSQIEPSDSSYELSRSRIYDAVYSIATQEQQNSLACNINVGIRNNNVNLNRSIKLYSILNHGPNKIIVKERIKNVCSHQDRIKELRQRQLKINSLKDYYDIGEEIRKIEDAVKECGCGIIERNFIFNIASPHFIQNLNIILPSQNDEEVIVTEQESEL